MSDEAHRLFEPEDEPNIVSRSTPTSEQEWPDVIGSGGKAPSEPQEWTEGRVFAYFESEDFKGLAQDINAALAAERREAFSEGWLRACVFYVDIDAEMPEHECSKELKTRLDAPEQPKRVTGNKPRRKREKRDKLINDVLDEFAKKLKELLRSERYKV